MKRISFLLLCAAAVFSLNAFGREYWKWDAASGAALGPLAVQAPDGSAAIYQPGQISNHNFLDVARVKLPAGETMAFAGEYRIPGDLREGSFQLCVVFFDRKGRVIRQDVSHPASLADGWRELCVLFAPPAGAVDMLLRLVNTGTSPVWLRRAVLRDATAEEADRIARFAGTLEEKLVLHSHTVIGNPEAVFVMDYDDPAPGDRYSMKVVWDHESGERGLVDIASPMEVPPVGERRLERVVFHLKVTRCSGDLKLMPMALAGDVNLCPENVNFGEMDVLRDLPPDGEWRRFEYELPAGSRIADGSFLLRLYGVGTTTFRLGLPRFYYSDGTVATGFSVWRDPLWKFPDWSDHPFVSAFRDTEGMVLCDTGQGTQAGESGRQSLLKLKAMFPNLANDVIYAIGPTLRDRQWYEDHGIPVVYQNIPNELWQLAIARDPDVLCFKPDSYRGIKEHLHKFNAAHPAWREVYGRWAERMKDYGIPEVMSIDCCFQFSGDDDQYEPWFRGFLKEEDEGYRYRDEKKRRFFGDYFEAYAGFRPTPEFFGWKSWDEYSVTSGLSLWRADAPAELRRRGWLDTLLRHYAFLMYNTRLGEELGARGIAYFLMNNGDDWLNGNDWQVNARLSGVPGFVEETFFYHPSCVFHAFTDAMAFREFYDVYGGRHRLIQEVGLGGHGNPYWDIRNTFALVSTMCAATPYHSLQVDWPFESSMESLRGNANDYTRPRYNTFVTMASAYNSQRELGVGEIPESVRRTLIFHETPSNIAFFEHQRRRLGNVLQQGPWYGSNANFNLWELPFVQEAKVLFNDYYALPAGGAEKLIDWLNARPGRSLVLSGYSAGKAIDGTYWGAAMGWDLSHLNRPDQFAALIGSIRPENRRYFCSREPDDVLMADEDGRPLLSVYQGREGRKVYYYSAVPGDDAAQDARVVGEIMNREFGAAPYVKRKGDTRVFSSRYADGSRLFCLFSHEGMERFRMHQVIRTATRYDFEDPEVDNLISVSVEPGDYLLYAFLADELRKVTIPESGRLELALCGQTAELCYLIPADRTDRLEQLRRLRKEWQEKLLN